MRTVLFTLFIFFVILYPGSSQDNYISLKPERVYLHTDKNIYLAGEYLYYAMYLKGYTDQISKYAYLLIRDSANSVVTHVRLEVNNQRSFGSIFLSDTLKTGYYQVVCFTNLMRNAEDTFFRKEIVIANRFDDKLDQFTEPVERNSLDTSDYILSEIPNTDDNIVIHPDRLIFKPREKISFSIDKKDQKGGHITSLSVSVSEFVPGTPVGPTMSDYFNTSVENSGTDNTNPVQCKFRPEFNGAVLQGRVISYNRSGSVVNPRSDPAKRYTVLLSTIDSIANLQFTRTDSLGLFGFNLNPWFEGKEIIVRIKEEADANIVLDDKTSLVQTFSPSGAYNAQGIKNYLLKSGKIAQVQRYYNRRVALDTQKVPLIYREVPRVYNKRYLTVFPSDYIELHDFIEISREIVPGLKVRKIDDNYVSGYTNLQYQSDSDEEPLIFLDGIPIDDVNQIITLGTSDIKSIEIVPVIRYLGEMSFQGILSIVSNNLAVNHILFKTPAIRYQVLGCQYFTKPEPFRPESLIEHFPDLRQVLLWEPELIPESSDEQIIECYASDLEGTYRIDVQGISADGDPLAGSAYFKIQSR
jgi:hypothetical protein